MEKLKLSPPWVGFANELKALFEQDEEIRVIFDQEGMEIKIFVDNAAKAEALTALLPELKVFGSVEVKITVVPSDEPGNKYRDDFITAFDGNSALCYIREVDSPLGDFTYIVWQNVVVQYYDDNLADLHGLRSTLYEQIARDVFPEMNGVFHCTDIGNGLNAPLGEWP